MTNICICQLFNFDYPWKAEEKSEAAKGNETKEDETEPSPSKKPRPATETDSTGISGVKEIVFSFDTTGSMYPCLTQVFILIQAFKN